MPRRGGRHFVLVKPADEAMLAFRMEVVRDLGLEDKIGKYKDFKHLTTEEAGLIGGTMVRRIQAAGEWAIQQRYAAGEQRLMPDEALPAIEDLQESSNNGNRFIGYTPEPRHTPSSGQYVTEQDLQLPRQQRTH